MNPDLISLGPLHMESNHRVNSSDYRKAVAELCEKSERLKIVASRLQSEAVNLSQRVKKTLREIHEHQPGWPSDHI